MIHPRNSIQHLSDKLLYPATFPGLTFTGPQGFLMDHLQSGMNGAPYSCSTFYAISSYVHL